MKQAFLFPILLAAVAVPSVAQLTITTTSLPTGEAGIVYFQSLTATGGQLPLSWTIVSGALPPGLTLAGNGDIGGTSTSAGLFPFTIRVSDSGGQFTTAALSINVVDHVSIATTSLAEGVVGRPYSQTLSAAGGQGPFIWSIVTTNLPPGITPFLPPGLSLDPSTGVISGTPTVQNTFPQLIIVHVTDALNVSAQKVFTEPKVYSNVTLALEPPFSSPIMAAVGEVFQAPGVVIFVTGGKAPYSDQTVSGALPPGLTMEVLSGGTDVFIRGIPTTLGLFSFTITANDSLGQTGTLALSINVNPAITITTTSLAAGETGMVYSQSLAAAGGVPPYHWAVFSGTLPPGLTLTLSGVIQGTPTSSGLFPFTVSSGDQSQFARSTLSINVVPRVSIATTSLKATVGSAFSQPVITTGGIAPFSWRVASGILPAGLSLDPSTGVISGLPTVAGSQTFTVGVTDALQATAQTTLTLTVNTGLTITTPSLSAGEVGIGVYVQTLTAAGGQPPLSWTILSGALPPGLALNAANGVIQGIPSSSGLFPFTVSVSDSGGGTDTAAFSINVVPHLSIATTSLPNGRIGQAFSQTLVSSGGFAPVSWSVISGNFPAGLLFASTGLISGTPTVAGPYTFTVRVVDGFNIADLMTFTLIVEEQLTYIGVNGPFDLTLGKPYSQTLKVIGNPPFFFSLSFRSLPPGLILDSSLGTIQGTPTALGTFNPNIFVADSTGQAIDVGLLMNVSTLSITTTSLPNGTVGSAYSQALATAGETGAVGWVVNHGNLPAGLALDRSTGVISGTPTVEGPQTFQVRAVTSSQSAAAIFTLLVTTVTITTSSSFTGALDTPFSQTLTATGGASPYTWSVSAGALPPGLQLNSATGTITGTPNALGTANLDFTVTDSAAQTATQHAAFTINLRTLTPTIAVGASTQPAVTLTLSSALSLDITGTLAVSFNSSVGGTDQTIRFSNSSPTLNFVIPSGTTQATFPAAPNAALIKGSVAGTITLQVTALDAAGTSLLPPAPLTRIIVIDPATPVITSVTLKPVTGGINVLVTGYSNTREVSTGLFHFTVSTGNTLSQPDISAPLAAAYTTWFSNPLANATGGQFMLTMPFTVTQGAGTSVTSVQVTLTNSKGPSNPFASQ